MHLDILHVLHLIWGICIICLWFRVRYLQKRIQKYNKLLFTINMRIQSFVISLERIEEVLRENL